jgi:hypothetical protein
MSKLLISVKCGTEACGDCPWPASLGPCEWFCQLFDRDLASTRHEGLMPFRCKACLTAERRAKEVGQ